MPIQFNTEKATTTFASQADSVASSNVTQSGESGSVLSGAALKVVDGSTTDLEKLVARLKSEQDRARFSLLLTSLASIGQSLTEAQRRTLEQGLALSEKLTELTKSVEDLSKEETKEKAAILILQAKIDSLQKQIDQAIQDGKDHNELVAEQKRVRKVLDAKTQVVADIQGEIAKAKNEISTVKGQISAVVKSIGVNEVKTIANELSTLAGPEKAERPAEAEKEAEKEEEVSIFAAIRDSLAEIERDITETIAENRVETV